VIIKSDKDIIHSYLEDSSNITGGFAEAVVIPENIEELSEFIKKAASQKKPVTVSGGGTGTTGSRVPFGGYAVSLERINRILSLSGGGMEGSVESGVRVEDLKAECEKKKLFYTSHPTEKTATVGGTIATNASGARSFKYGSIRRYVKRLKMVLAGGEIFELERGHVIIGRDNSSFTAGGRKITLPMPSYKLPAVKNSAGYFAEDGMDLIDLFIGQEGTLSIIVEAGLDFVEMPEKILSAFVFFKKEEDAWHFASAARDASREKRTNLDALSIEYFDTACISILKTKVPAISADAKSAIFFEQGIHKDDEDKVLGEWTGLIKEYNSDEDNAWVAMSESDSNKFLELRHLIPVSMNEIIRRNGFRKIATDIAVPASGFYEIIDFYSDELKMSGIEFFIFGHIGECHLHVNILPKSPREFEKAKSIALELVKKGVSLGGTVSAEHGIGKLKHEYLEAMYGKKGVLDMARIKNALDPEWILGRNNIFPVELKQSLQL